MYIYIYISTRGASLWLGWACTHPQFFEKLHYVGIYPLTLSVFCTKLTLFSLRLGLSDWIFVVTPFSSAFSSSLRTSLTFFIFKAYLLFTNYTPALILLQPRGSLSPIPVTFYFFKCLLLST